LKQRSDSGKKRPPAKVSQVPIALTPGKKWLFRSLALLLPFLVLMVVEAGLRIAGYGYNPSFFKEIQIGGEDFYVENDRFGLRFFPPQMVRMPAPNRMRVHKPPGVFRIFVFGESAAMGDPEPAFGPGRYLQALLEARHPGQKFEVMNVAMTAINSHTVLPIARECASLDGDLWIIYMGNNEMVGPFGAGTVFGAQAPPMAFIRLNLALQKTRIGQLSMALLRRLHSRQDNSPVWGGMEMFLRNQISPSDPRKELIYHHFKSNLDGILHTGLRSGARVVLSTMAVNLKDCPPFASLNRSNLSVAAKGEFDHLYNQGLDAEKQGQPANAAKSFEAAAALDPKFSELQYRWASCLLALTNAAAAREHFQLACDTDALPFRADSRINAMIVQAGSETITSHMHLVDAAKVLEQASESGICGAESFCEHVHFTFAGNYRLARAWAGEAEVFLPDNIKALAGNAQGVNPENAWATQAQCERRLGLTDWNRVGVYEAIARRLLRPPLSSQFNNPARLQALQNQLRATRERLDDGAALMARELYTEAIQRAPEDFYVHEHYADFLEAIGDFQQSTREWQEARRLIPQDFLASFQLGRLLGRAGQTDQAKASLLQAVTLRPTFSDGWLELAKVHDLEGKNDLALDQYRRAIRLQPANYEAYCNLGKLQARLNFKTEAFENLRESIRLNPGYWEGHYALGGVLGYDNQIAAARHEFEEVIRLNPRFAMGHLNLGVALLKENQFAGAAREFQETLRLEPTNSVARTYLNQAQSATGAK
jgi:tetratricopeptide (TPR) repeat protein